MNGSGMHTNVSISKGGKNLFWDPKGEEKMSKLGWEFVDRILTHGNDICLLLNASVNAYRRLDPHFEAPNQIKASATDRGSMIRIPIGNEKQRARRSPLRGSGRESLHGAAIRSSRPASTATSRRSRTCARPQRYLPDNIYDAIENFSKADWTTKLLGEDVKGRYADLKTSLRRPLPAPAGHLRKGARSAVPPRSLQPVPLESVLDLGVTHR